MSEKKENYVRSVAAHQKIKEKEFWLKQLDGDIKKTSFPFDFKAVRKNKPHLQTLDFTLPEEIFARLMRLSNHSDLRLFIILFTTLVILLEKYTGSSDIIIGAPIHKQEIQGELINTVLVLRNRFHGNMTVKELLLQVSHNTFAAAEHQNYPVETLLYQLNIPYEGDEFPLFDIMTGLENIHDPDYINHIQTNIRIAFNRTGAEMQGEFAYNTHRYKRDSIKRIIAHYTRLLERSLQDIDLPIKDIELLSEAEQRELLVDFNRSAADSPGDTPLHELFRLQAEQTPAKLALVSDNSMQLTYGELNRGTDNLAYRLKSKGLLPDTIVGIMIGRSLGIPLGILGILKAGGAYLPIDPGFPAARIAFMLEDCGSRFLLSNTAQISRFERGTFKQEIIDLDNNSGEKTDEQKEPGSRPGTANSGANLAYVIFTSGSTGKSKGILTCHRNVVRVVKNTNYIDIHETDRVLQLSNYAFDGSVFDIFGALLNGASLVLVKEEDLAAADRLAHIIQRENITLFFSTTALFNLLTEIDIQCFKHVRKVLFGGEVVSVKHVEKTREYLGKNKIIHVYGPTETTVYASYYNILAIEPGVGTIPIGKPISNTEVYILDEYLHPVPIGGIGEIFIGGEGTARGYLNNPGLTNKKFLRGRPDASRGSFFKKRPPGRRRHKIYRTGDLGRWLPGGNIEFIGRKDFQVKIRGFRIEPEEIEIQLLNHKEIKEAKVLVWEKPGTGDKYIVAYFVSTANVGETGLKEVLKKSLPYYMIPHYFISLEKMPLTANGKVDGKALPEPEVRTTAAFVAPRDTLEKKLTEIWSRVLGVERTKIGIDSDFFELDGHSLKVTILIAMIHKEFDVKVELKEIFRTPTIRELSGHIKTLKKDRYAAITPVEKKEYYPLAPAQKRLYILQVFEQDSTAYNIPQRIPLEGEPDRRRLEETFRKLIRRHDSLRTSFHLAADEPVQRIHDRVEFEIEFFEDRDTRPSAKNRLLPHFIRPFDLGQAPLLRAVLVREREKDHFLLLDLHHIITDGTSQGVLISDFNALHRGKEMTPLRLQYKDYSGWQYSPGQKQFIKKQETFWINRFPGEPPVLHLPTDFPRPLRQSFEGASVGFGLNKDVTASLRHLARENDVTLYMLFLVIFNILLFKLSSQEDIIVGTPVAARRHADLEPIVGMFVNTLPMRNFPNGTKTLNQFLEEVKASTLAAYENQEYPFEELVEQISVPRDIGRNPLFDVMFNWWNQSDYPADISKSTGEGQLEHQEGTAKFDLNLTGVDYGEWFYFNLEYCTRLFTPGKIDKFCSYFKKILPAVLEDRNQALAAVKIFSDEEIEAILKLSGGEKKSLAKNLTIPGLFEKKVKRVPDAAAVIFADQVLGYRELNRRANQLARFLKEKGVGPGDIVGIMVTRSLEMIIGLLAILKAGGAYLPISPGYPRERKKYMMRDGQIRLLLSNCINEGPGEDLPEGIELLDLRHQGLYEGDGGSPRHTGKGTDPVYVIYTSGSTGKPKGVILEQRNVVNLLIYDFEYTNIDCSRILQFHTLSFDASFHEIFCALLSGNRLYLIAEEIQTDIPRLFHLVALHQVKTLFLPMSFLRVIFNDAENIKYIPGCVSHIQTAGEQVIVNEWFRRYLQENKVCLHNHYGPSESHVVTALTLSPGDDIPGFPTIGKPILNTDIYILSKDNRLLPLGVPGELCIGGIQVGRGYLNRPALTAEKFLFLPSGFYRSHMSHMSYIYKAGDLARWQADGNIEFLGRIDQQVKIRGMRVEPGEIEMRLSAHEHIKEAIVSAREKGESEKYLCAYIVPTSASRISPQELREYLSRTLPDYMIPAHFVILEKIPLTPGGKVDRKALPAPDTAEVSENYTGPRNKVEEKLVRVWADVLEMEPEAVSIDANFFALGGHSLKATVLLFAVHKEFNVKAALGNFFQQPTIRSFARYISGISPQAYTSYTSIEPTEKKEYYPLSSAQKRLYILQQVEKDSIGYNEPLVLIFEGNLDRDRLENTFRKMIKRHESLRSSFEMKGDEIVQRVHKEVPFTLEYDGSQVQEARGSDALSPGDRSRREKGSPLAADTIKSFIRVFDLAKPPLIRLGLIKTGAHTHILIMDMHHIITDGVTMNLFTTETRALYAGLELPELRLQYKDFSQWQNSAWQISGVKKEELYWLEEFKNGYPDLNLPIDFPRPEVLGFEGNAIDFEIDIEETRTLKQIAAREGATFFMILLALFHILLTKECHQEEIIIGTPTAGRRHADLGQIIGFFVNMLALRITAREDKTFREFLQEVKHKTLNAYDNQDYPFEHLVEKVLGHRDSARHSLVDVVFVFRNIDTRTGKIPEIEIPGLRITLYKEYSKSVSPFDIVLQGGQAGEKLYMNFQYRTRLFKEETIHMFIRHFQEVVSRVSADVNVKLGDIKLTHDLLSAAPEIFSHEKGDFEF